MFPEVMTFLGFQDFNNCDVTDADTLERRF